jgi:large subunit ribosomal protein L9
MQVILLEHVSRLGGVGQLVNVKDGYGRNFLIPTGKAIRATKANIQDFEAQREALERQNVEKREAAKKQAEALGKISVKVIRQASDDGKLFGSVSVSDVAKALKEAGYDFVRQQIDLLSTIKTLGLYHASLSLHPEVKIKIDVQVVRNAESSAYDAIAQEAEEDAESNKQENAA